MKSLLKILFEIKRLSGDLIYDRKQLVSVKGVNLEIGKTVYFSSSIGGMDVYQPGKIINIKKQQRNRFSFYYKIFLELPNGQKTGFFTIGQLYVKKSSLNP